MPSHWSDFSGLTGSRGHHAPPFSSLCNLHKGEVLENFVEIGEQLYTPCILRPHVERIITRAGRKCIISKISIFKTQFFIAVFCNANTLKLSEHHFYQTFFKLNSLIVFKIMSTSWLSAALTYIQLHGHPCQQDSQERIKTGHLQADRVRSGGVRG